MKIIKINCCNDCPWLDNGRFCIATKRMLEYQGKYGRPPVWCPLDEIPNIERPPCGEDKTCSDCSEHGKCP